MSITRMYSIAPAHVYTGGPTALHQLCYYTNNNFSDLESLMAYTGVTNGIDPVHPEYKKYKLPWVSLSKIEDSPKNLLIIPETQTHLLYRFKLSRKAIYWLSVDNFFISINQSFIKSLLNTIEYVLRYNSYGSYGDRIYFRAMKEIYNAINEKLNRILIILNKADIHIAQSKYAEIFLGRIGIDKNFISTLREPIEDNFYNVNIDEVIENKSNIISFNARKSFSAVYKIIRKIEQYNKNIRIIPLKNVGKEKMIRILSKSKIFIDIGYHPGRDRPAREAGALANVIIANRSGGYFFFEDLPIPNEYCIYCKDFACKDISNDVANFIIDIIENYEYHIKKFNDFIKYIREEPNIYLNDLKRLKVLIEQL